MNNITCVHTPNPRTPAKRQRLSLSIALAAAGSLACIHSPSWAQATEQDADTKRDPRLETVVVSGTQTSEAEQAKTRLQQVAGTVSVVDNKALERTKASTAEEVLAYQPGVYAAATSGTGANKISIRGSGLNTFYQGYVLGIKFLYDGIPITGPGGTHEDLLSVAGLNYTEVLNGGNAFAYNAVSLGGAVNFVTHTGYSAPGHYARFEVGSYGYRRAQLSTGGVVGDSDYYVSILRNERDGFQDDTPNKGRDLIANFGHRFNENLETRLLLRYREEQLLNGSTLTRAQIKDDPSQNNVLSGRKKAGTTLLASNTTWHLDDSSRLELGLGVNDYPLDNGWHYAVAPQDWRSTDTNLTLRYLRSGDRLFGKPSDTTLSFSDTRLVFGDVKAYDQGTKDLRQWTDYSGSRDTVFSLGNELQLQDDFWLSSGLALINVDRRARIKYSRFANTSQFPDHYSYNDWEAAPRLGFRYQLKPELQVFGNVSRAIDAPVTWQMGSTGTPYIRPLDTQKGTSVELGIRGSSGIFDGSLTLYRSWISDELLTVVIQQATATQDQLTANSNASDTIHQGLEAALQARLWQSEQGHRLTLRQAYTFNDFYYEDDDEFGSNELPSLPRHLYQAELQFDHARGFYASLNLRSASSYYVDYANTLGAPSYTVWGAKLGYEPPSKRWNLFLDLRNLTDEKYATAANTAYDLKGADSANFYPGDRFSTVAGIAVHF